MHKVKVYDLPTRVFHWMFALLFIVSFTIGKFTDDESTLYAYHMMSGLTMGLIVILRLIWGIIGTKYAKLSSFQLNVKSLIKYFQNFYQGKTTRSLGHNPASSFAAILMFSFSIFLVVTGLLMANRIGKEFFEEIHEILAFMFLITILFHIAGVLIHQFRHQDGMIFSMINGNKNFDDGQNGINNQAPIVMLFFLAISIGFMTYLVSNFDSNSGKLDLFGKKLQLIEIEQEHSTDYYNKYYDLENED